MTTVATLKPPEFYTYVHLRADDGRVFYIGKGKGDRATSTHHRNSHWHATAKKHGMRVQIAAHWVKEFDAFEHEKFLIACFRDLGHPLCNRTDGGEGGGTYVRTAETRLKYSMIHKGKIVSQETRDRISLAKRGKRIASPSAETRGRISAAQKGRSRPYAAGENNVMQRPEVRAKVSAASKGFTMSAAAKEKISKANAGRVWTEGQRAAIKGRPWSDARRAAVKVRL